MISLRRAATVMCRMQPLISTFYHQLQASNQTAQARTQGGCSVASYTKGRRSGSSRSPKTQGRDGLVSPAWAGTTLTLEYLAPPIETSQGFDA